MAPQPPRIFALCRRLRQGKRVCSVLSQGEEAHSSMEQGRIPKTISANEAEPNNTSKLSSSSSFCTLSSPSSSSSWKLPLKLDCSLSPTISKKGDNSTVITTSHNESATIIGILSRPTADDTPDFPPRVDTRISSSHLNDTNSSAPLGNAIDWPFGF